MDKVMDRIGRERVEIVVGAASIGFGKTWGALGAVGLALVIVYAAVAIATGTVVIVRALPWV